MIRMGYGTPEHGEYHPEENPQAVSPLKKKRSRSERFSRIATGIKQVGAGTLREAHSFAKEVRSEGVKSAYKTQRSLQRAARQPRRVMRTGIIRSRPVMPGSPSLGERTVIEASANYTPHLDRSYFNEGEAQKDLLGSSSRDMTALVNSAESNLKKREIKYY